MVLQKVTKMKKYKKVNTFRSLHKVSAEYIRKRNRFTHLLCVYAFGHGPCRHNVIHNSLAQSFRHLIELQKVSHIVQHLMVAVSVRVHLLKDGGHVSKDGGIQKSCRSQRAL